jgi:hypothetical protein
LTRALHDLLFHPEHLAFEAILADRQNLRLTSSSSAFTSSLLIERTSYAVPSRRDDLPQIVFLPTISRVVDDVRRVGTNV